MPQIDLALLNYHDQPQPAPPPPGGAAPAPAAAPPPPGGAAPAPAAAPPAPLPPVLYPNQLIYADVSPATTLTVKMAELAYQIQDRRFSEDEFASQMDELAGFGVNSIEPPSTYNGSLVFHVSRGNPSASIFFRIYAVNPGYASGITQALSVVNLNHQRGLTIDVQTSRTTRVNGIEVNQTNHTFTHAGTNYRLIFEIVGIGNHDGSGTEFKLRLWNAPVFEGRLIRGTSIRLA